MHTENQEPNPPAYSAYASAPNDVWSLGVILVNLTCGRNPWKRASMSDPTFRAYRRDPDFLKTILPISDELNDILKRVFEVRPERRISLGELTQAILVCRSFTFQAPPTPPESPAASATYAGIPTTEAVPQLALPAQQFPQQCHEFFAPPPQQPALFTPPGSGRCTPQATLNTYAPRSATPCAYPGNFFGQEHFRRCAQALFQSNVVPHPTWTPTYF